MPGYVDLGDDGDVPLCRVSDDLADVVLGVETAVRPSVPRRLGRRAERGLAPPRTDLGESRVPQDLHPPALVVGEVQMQCVEAVHGHQIEEAQHVVLGHEVPRHVQHRAAPGEPRRVLDAYGGHRPSHPGHLVAAVDLGGQRLQQALTSVEGTGPVAAFDDDAVGAHPEPVRLRAEVLAQPQVYRVLRLGQVCEERQVQAGGGP